MKSQEMKFEGTQPVKKEVLDLLKKEAEIMDNVTNVKKRDSLRRQILSKAFFYQGLDGRPINLDGLTNRQTKNQFKMLETKLISQTLYQYESTAILVLIDWQKVADKGEIHESYNSFLMVMGIEEGEWKILSDIIGRKPNL
ncbi:MAG TPA: hypothetical protein VK498_03765 [Ferruginibacter sp.]|nr:hypothetical protein [Ferruginibacter sp.]